MRFRPSSYSHKQFHTKNFRRNVVNIAKWLPKIMKDTGADAVAVTGKSGMSMAFGARVWIDFPLIVVRKENESSHGNRIEGTSGVDVQRYLILDDFVQSGATVNAIMKAIGEHHQRYDHWYPEQGAVLPECVGVVCYNSDDSGLGRVVTIDRQVRDCPNMPTMYVLPYVKSEY